MLKPSGSLFVNLGDKYAGGGMGGHSAGLVGTRPQGEGNGYARRRVDLPSKSLMGLPWRYALGCIDDLGLILRAEVIWSKPNGLPESVTDRVRRSHEQWFHLTKMPRYFAAVDEIREAYAPATAARYASGYGPNTRAQNGAMKGSAGTVFNGDLFGTNPLGKLPGSVWEIATEPLTVPDALGVDHFAAFPTEWPKRIIAGWSPSGICTECGEGRVPVTCSERTSRDALRPAYGAGNHGTGGSTLGPRGVVASITGYACACAEPTAPTRPAVVLDPFGGTGTVALVASALGRIGISNDMSADYCRIAEWRTNDPAQRAKALCVAKPPVQIDGQGDLFAEMVGAA